jgi:hypothetical protein
VDHGYNATLRHCDVITVECRIKRGECRYKRGDLLNHNALVVFMMHVTIIHYMYSSIIMMTIIMLCVFSAWTLFMLLFVVRFVDLFNPFTAEVAIMRLLGSAPKSHLCDHRRRSKVTGLSDLMTVFIDLGCLYCKQTKRA